MAAHRGSQEAEGDVPAAQAGSQATSVPAPGPGAGRYPAQNPSAKARMACLPYRIITMPNRPIARGTRSPASAACVTASIRRSAGSSPPRPCVRPGVPRRAGRALPQPAEIVHRHRDAALHALQVAAALALTPWLAPGLRWPGSQPGRSSGEQWQAADRRHHRDHPVAGSADPVQPCPVCQERGVIGPSPCLGFQASSP